MEELKVSSALAFAESRRLALLEALFAARRFHDAVRPAREATGT